MNNFYKLIYMLVLMSSASCAQYLLVPFDAYQMAKGFQVGTPSLPYYANSNTTLDAINAEFKNTNAKITLEDTYTYAYGKSLKGAPLDGDTGQSFKNMATATRYLQKILKAKGVSDPESYFLTSIDSAKEFGFTLIAAVQRQSEKVEVIDKFGASNQNMLSCNDPSYYQPYKFDCRGKPLDTVFEWSALPNDCFIKQGHQAILLTLAANKILERNPRNDYWDAERKWIAGDYKSVALNQDQMVCQQLGIEKGYTQQKNVFSN